MDYLEDYFNAFTEEITKYQWPDPFESIEEAKDLLQSFLDEAEHGETILLYETVLKWNSDGIVMEKQHEE